MKPCIFCEIIQLKAEASVVYENKHLIAIMDAYPLTEGHVLVIPKTHESRINCLEPKLRSHMFDVGHSVAEAQKALGLGVGGTNLLLNDGKDANQTVPHVHLHVIPRSRFDWLTAIPRLLLHVTGIFGFGIDRKGLDEKAEAIKAHLAPIKVPRI